MYRPEADEFVFDLARRYTADYTVITRRYHRYSSSVCSKEKLSGQEATVPQEYEVDIEDAQDDEVRLQLNPSSTVEEITVSSVSLCLALINKLYVVLNEINIVVELRYTLLDYHYTKKYDHVS